MYLELVLIAAFSLVFQAAVAVLAIRLIRITGSSRAWIVIAVAMLVMALRRLAVLVGLLVDPGTLEPTEFWSDALGLVNAILMLVGIAWIGPLIRTIQRAKETIEHARDQLEREVAQRTADLVRAHEELQKEFAQRAKAEEALRGEHARVLGVLEMGERDQRLLAYEIHDGFVQPASAALMNLQASLAGYATDRENAVENVIRGVQLLQESLAQVRGLISGMRPVVLEEDGLVAAIETLVRDTQDRTDVQIDWSHERIDRLAPPLEKTIFRIVQEALRNALRHSRSKRVEIALTKTAQRVVVRIEDHGAGFEPAVPKPGHFGLEGIEERAKLLGGAARVESAPGKGTRVTAEFPLVGN